MQQNQIQLLFVSGPIYVLIGNHYYTTQVRQTTIKMIIFRPTEKSHKNLQIYKTRLNKKWWIIEKDKNIIICSIIL